MSCYRPSWALPTMPNAHGFTWLSQRRGRLDLLISGLLVNGSGHYDGAESGAERGARRRTTGEEGRAPRCGNVVVACYCGKRVKLNSRQPNSYVWNNDMSLKTPSHLTLNIRIRILSDFEIFAMLVTNSYCSRLRRFEQLFSCVNSYPLLEYCIRIRILGDEFVHPKYTNSYTGSTKIRIRM